MGMIGVRYVQCDPVHDVRSMVHNDYWTGGMMKAECPLNNKFAYLEKYRFRHGNAYIGHEAPDMECTCGYYAYDSLPHMDGIAIIQAIFASVIIVGGYGKVVQHEKGFRSEYMQPLSVIWPFEIEELSIRLEQQEAIRDERGVTLVMKGSWDHYGYTHASFSTALRVSKLLSIPIVDGDRAKEMLGE